MTPITKKIILSAIKVFREAESHDKERYILNIQNNLKTMKTL